MIRLWNDEIDVFKKKVVIDQMNMQKVMEVLIKMYLEDNKEIMSRISKYKSEKYARKRKYNSWDRYEAELLQRKLEEFSPINEIDRLVAAAMEDEKPNEAK